MGHLVSADRESFSEDRVRTMVDALGFVTVRGGWPDYLVLGRDGTLKMAIEVKAPGDQLRPNQKLVIAALQQAGVDVRVVRFENIAETLEALNAMDRGEPVVTPKSVGLSWLGDTVHVFEETEDDRRLAAAIARLPSFGRDVVNAQDNDKSSVPVAAGADRAALTPGK